ncbi:hypothetical protein JCM9492_15380 [Aquifex pyrophilus]
MRLKVNGKVYSIKVDEDKPLLWVLREDLKLKGTKFGCGKGICGSCTVVVNGEAVRSCITPVKAVNGKDILTIEGIPESHPIKRAWIELQVPQCGYCQPGKIMEAYALLNRNPSPSREEILSVMSTHLCRCGTYPRILKAILKASELMGVEK